MMKGKTDQACKHPTCIRSKDYPAFINGTKSTIFHQQGDFNQVILFPIREGTSYRMQPRNPHCRHSDNWASFERFKRDCTFRVSGDWPSGIVFYKVDIGFEYSLFARRIRGEFDPLTETYSYEIILDVEEAAVYVQTN